VINITVAGAALQTWPMLNVTASAAAGTTPSVHVPVISFHMDQPYIDPSGAAPPYVPPQGARAAAPLLDCDDELLRHHHCYAI
jgi:hypothetical protein